MNASQIRDFLLSVYGNRYNGYIVVWRKATMESTYHGQDDLEELATLVERIAERDDVYLVLGLQKAESKKRGKAETVVAVPGFFADIDFASMKSSNKRYPNDLDEAMRILASFPLRPTWIIHSGNGLHALWLLQELFPTTSKKELVRAKRIWTAFQRTLIAHFQKHERQIDSVGDLVRNFRIPGTLNHKSDPPKPVELIEHHPERRYSIAEIEELVAHCFEPEFDRKAKRRQERHPPADHESIREGCAWYEYVTGDGAATCSEPDWYAAASITAWCEDGDRIFHEYSRKHPGYDEREAAEKLKRARTETGPRRCQGIALDLGHTGCEVCPNRERVSSPIQLGRVEFRPYEPDGIGPVPIGYYGSLFLLRNQQTGDVEKKTASQLAAPAELIGLAPRWFWLKRYVKVERNEIKIDTQVAADALIQACREAGAVDGSAIRGIGVWREGNRLVANLGGTLIESDQFLYTTSSKPLSLVQGSIPSDLLMDFLSRFAWKTAGGPELVSGWAFLSILCGALEWRPHLAISGPAASGKTTVLKLLGNMLAPFALTFEGVSSEAGIRQSLGPDARPIIIDELESGGARDLGRLNRFSKLILSASGATGEIARGTPEGKAILYNVRTMFAFGAINIYTSSAAEASRLLRVELRQPEGERADREAIITIAKRLEKVGPAFCQLAIDHAEDIFQSVPLLHQKLAVMQEREADNLAPVLAAHFVLLHRRPITQEEAGELAARFEPVLEQQRERLQGQDHLECLNTLMGFALTYEAGNERSRELIGNLMQKALRSTSKRLAEPLIQSAIFELEQVGLRIEPGGLLVPTSHPGLKQVFRGTPWEGGLWGSALARIKGAERTRQRRFPGGVRSFGVFIPLASLCLTDEGEDDPT